MKASRIIMAALLFAMATSAWAAGAKGHVEVDDGIGV